MAPVVIARGATCAKRGGEGRGNQLASPYAAAAATIFNSCRERGAYTASAIFHGAVFPVRRTVGAIPALDGQPLPGSPLHDAKPVRYNSCRPFEASGSLISGSHLALAPFHQSLRNRAYPFHLPISFRDALASQEQEITERIPDDAKTGARPRNLTARDGKHAC